MRPTKKRKHTLRKIAEPPVEPMTEGCITGADPWRDVSSYSPGERGTREPSVWELQLLAGVRVTVHRWRSLPGWHLTCRALNVDRERLAAQDADEAKREALAGLATRAAEIARALQAVAGAKP